MQSWCVQYWEKLNVLLMKWDFFFSVSLSLSINFSPDWPFLVTVSLHFRSNPDWINDWQRVRKLYLHLFESKNHAVGYIVVFILHFSVAFFSRFCPLLASLKFILSINQYKQLIWNNCIRTNMLVDFYFICNIHFIFYFFRIHSSYT